MYHTVFLIRKLFAHLILLNMLLLKLRDLTHREFYESMLFKSYEIIYIVQIQALSNKTNCARKNRTKRKIKKITTAILKTFQHDLRTIFTNFLENINNFEQNGRACVFFCRTTVRKVNNRYFSSLFVVV